VSPSSTTCYPLKLVTLRKAAPPRPTPTVRSVFVIGPDTKIKAMLTYPMSTGRNFDEVLRILDSVQLTARHTVATPVNWKPGEDVIVAPTVSTDAAKQKYPAGFREVALPPLRPPAAIETLWPK
jgi:thioredoxin-dependent peroxiredoxin